MTLSRPFRSLRLDESGHADWLNGPLTLPVQEGVICQSHGLLTLDCPTTGPRSAETS